jgi:DNA segregation ATPase FtsK/SpoIIIE, S-DNA-T family
MPPKREHSSDKKPAARQDPLFNGADTWRGKLDALWQRFSQYGWDLLGIILLAFALIFLLGFFDITSGVFVRTTTRFLSIALGLGRFLLVIAFVSIALQVIQWRKHPPGRLDLSKILAFEFAFLLLLGVFSLAKGGGASEARAGFDPGGVIGWGIAEIFRLAFGATVGFVILTICLSISLIIAFRLFSRLEGFVRSQLDSGSGAEREKAVEEKIPAPAVVTEPDEQEKSIKPKPKKQVWLPPEFRKSFDSPSQTDEKPESQPERSQDLPPLSLLQKGVTYKPDTRSINMSAGLIEKTLDEFGIPAKVVGYRTGPTVTQFAVEPGYIDKSDYERHKIRVSQISSLQRDLALALSAERLRIEAPVPGKSYVGIEIPNQNSTDVHLRLLIESDAFSRVNSPLALALGRDVSGRPVVTDLATMPHLLIAGTTGSGKSVCITALTTCLVVNNTPEDLKLAMIDPKRVELMRFNGLPHLMGNVETEIERILGVLRWATTEMDFRYKLLEKARARHIDSYNMKMERQGKRKLPKIVILIDELADLMISAPDQTEHAIIRLAQKARAIGIHLIIATQRPSTDVVTGLIKANFPTRISFTVASSIDSRVILDTSGAETLLGRGDMLFLHPEIGLPLRAQGVIVADKELDKIIQWWKKQEKAQEEPAQPRYDDAEAPPWEERIGAEEEDEDEALIDEAIALIKAEGHASASYFQRQLHVGYPRAARLVDQLEEMGVIGPSQGGGREREILIDQDEDESEV